jgi:ankyrin repeat protein
MNFYHLVLLFFCINFTSSANTLSDSELIRKGKISDFEEAITNGFNFKNPRILPLIAQYNPNEDVLTHLIKKGLDINTQDDGGRPLLWTAIVENPNPKVAIELIKAGADLNKWNCIGWAIRRSDEDILNTLLNHRVDKNIKSSDENSTLITAAIFSTPQIIKILSKAGADVNAKDKKGNTPLMCAARAKRPSYVLESLLKAGADVNAIDKEGWTALMLVGQFDSKPQIIEDNLQVLLEAGADVNAQSKLGNTALMQIAKYGTPKAIKVLLEAGADVNAIDKEGWTALMQAARYGTPESIEVLLKAGAHVFIENNSSLNALNVAKSNNKIFDTPTYTKMKQLFLEQEKESHLIESLPSWLATRPKDWVMNLPDKKMVAMIKEDEPNFYCLYIYLEDNGERQLFFSARITQFNNKEKTLEISHFFVPENYDYSLMYEKMEPTRDAFPLFEAKGNVEANTIANALSHGYNRIKFNDYYLKLYSHEGFLSSHEMVILDKARLNNDYLSTQKNKPSSLIKKDKPASMKGFYLNMPIEEALLLVNKIENELNLTPNWYPMVDNKEETKSIISPMFEIISNRLKKVYTIVFKGSEIKRLFELESISDELFIKKFIIGYNLTGPNLNYITKKSGVASQRFLNYEGERSVLLIADKPEIGVRTPILIKPMTVLWMALQPDNLEAGDVSNFD